MSIRLVTQGFECTFSGLYLESEISHAVVNALVWSEKIERVEIKKDEQIQMIIEEGGEGVRIDGKWYYIYDAVDIVRDCICNLIVEEWKKEHENMLYVADSETWESREQTIKIIMENTGCSVKEAESQIAYSIKHGILYDVENYLLHYEI